MGIQQLTATVAGFNRQSPVDRNDDTQVVGITMSQATHTCTCGATLRYKQDLIKEGGTVSRTWLCKDCRTPVPSVTAEKIAHQHPS